MKGQLWTASLDGLLDVPSSLSESLSSSEVEEGRVAASLRLREALEEEEEEEAAEVVEVGADDEVARCGLTISSDGKGRVGAVTAGGDIEGNGYGDVED